MTNRTTYLIGKAHSIMKFKLLPIVIGISAAGYLLAKFHMFSRGLSTLVFLVMSVFFFMGVASAVSITIKLFGKKSPGIFAIDSVLCAVYVVLFYFFISLVVPLPAGSYDMKFNQQTWKQEDSSTFRKKDITPRQKMVGDVIENILPNKNRNEILGVLGPPTETDKWQNMKSSHLIYVLGPERGYMRIDYEWLFIYLESDQFKSATIGTD